MYKSTTVTRVSIASILHRFTKINRQFCLVSLTLILAAIGFLTSQLFQASNVYASTPDTAAACFNYSTFSNEVTISGYYQGSTNLPCPRDVVIPSTLGGHPVTTIDFGAFGFDELTSVTIPSSVTTINDSAFSDNKLTSVTIAGDITSAGAGIFADNPITSFSYNGTTYTSADALGEACYQFNSGTSAITGFNYADIATIKNYHQACISPHMSIPSTIGGKSVNMIDDNALYGINLTSVIIPNSVTSVGYSALAGNQLASLTIPSSVTTIGSQAFSNNQLTSVTIPSSVINIGNSAFSDNQLTSVTIQGDITTAGTSLFAGSPLANLSYNGATYTNSDQVGEPCYVFNSGTNTITGFNYADIATIKNYHQACLNKHLTIPSIIGGVPVNTIGSLAFGNYQLTSVTIPSSVTTIGSQAFYYSRLSSVSIPNSVNTIGNYAFSNNQLASVNIPSSVTSLGSQAFQFNQLTSVTIPSSVTTIGSSVFANNQLTSVAIPSSVTAIGNSAFANNQLTSIIIPGSVTTLDALAFYNNKLTTVTIIGDIITAGSQIFYGSPITRFSYNGSTYSSSDPLGEGCFNFDSGTGTISGLNFANISTIKNNHQACLNKNVIIPSTIGGISVTSIGNSAFSNDQLTSVTLPSSVTAIGYSAFSNNQLISVIIPSSVTSIDNTAFDSNPVTSDGQGGSLRNQLATPSPVTSQPTIVSTPTGTELNCIYPETETNLANDDNFYTYPLGLVNFCFSTSQSNNDVSLTFTTNLKPNEVIPRKYNPTTKTYTDLPASANPALTETTVNGQHALKLTYDITDNGPLDSDLTLGSIQDPVGLGISNTSAGTNTDTNTNPATDGVNQDGLADTGQSVHLPEIVATVLVLVGVGGLIFTWRRGKPSTK